MSYQPRWVRGVESGGDRECARRYDVIRELVRPYTRQMTVWDVGANLGYFGLRLAHDLEAISVMVDSRTALAEVCRENNLPTTVALTHHLSVTDLQELAASEHPDVVLALNVLHHFEDWHRALDAVLSMGGRVLIETPGRDDAGSAHYVRALGLIDALDAIGATRVAEFPSHITPGVMRPLYLVDRPKDRVSSGYAYAGRVRAKGPIPVRPHRIVSDVSQKRIDYDSGESRAWVPGMNLWNFAQMGGVWPDRASLVRMVRKAVCGLSQSHGDIRAWNVILQGQRVQLIDACHRRNDDVDGLKQTLAAIMEPSVAYA